MAVATNRRSPGRSWRPRLLCCQGFLASTTVVAALLLALSGFSAASKGLPQSAGGAGPSSHGLSKGDSVGGSGTADRRKRDRLPSSARPAPARQGDHDWKTRRKPATPAAAAERGRRQRPRPQQQHTAATGATRRAEGRPDEEDDDDDDDDEEDSSLGLGFESDSGELDYFSWSDDDDGDDAWSDDGGDAEESDWGRGAAGGPGGRGKARRHEAAKGGGGAAGGRVGRNMMSMSNIRSRLNVARKRASSVYREAKSLMSSEMEGVVLKATRPDDLPVKPKHLEALMRPTAEMPKEFNVYLPVVRKLWSKMADKEWRVAAKALYIVHRFAADGSIEHASNLKESVAVLRTHHDSRRKVNYFDMDTICDVKAPSWSGEDVAPMAEFLRGYADFVLRRTTQFGPAFAELLDSFAMLAGGGEVMSSVEGLVSAGSKCCLLREEQEGAVTVAAALQVAQDVRDVVEVCAAQLDYLAREWQARSAYPEEVDRWYSFLSENLEPVEALIGRSNELAERHKLPALRPLAAAPLVLKLRDEEIALEKEKRAVLEAEQQQQQQQQQRQRQQQQCSVDEGDEKRLRPRSHGEQARAVGVKATGRKEAAARDGGSVGEDQATARRQQGVRGREESAPASTPAGAPGDPAGVATKKKVRSAKGRATGGTKQSSSGSATAAAAVEARSSSSEGGDATEQPAARRPGGGTGTGAGTGAAAAPRQEDGARAMPSPGASAKRAASGDAAKSRAPKKKKRAPSSTGGKASGREERPTRSSSGAGGVERGAGGGATAAGGSGSSSRREQKRQVRGDSSVPHKERSKRLSPRSEKPPR